MGKKEPKVYGIPRADRADAKAALAHFRQQRTLQAREFDLRPAGGMVMGMVLFRPVEFTAGVCVKLFYDPARPFVWDIHLLGYPAMTGRAKFSIEWSNGTDTLRVDNVPIYATAAEFADRLPEPVKQIANVDGGTMLATFNGGQQFAQTGRWFVSFAAEPIWIPKIVAMSDPRLQGRALRNNIHCSDEFAFFRTLASVDAPTPIHPGAMFMAWPEHDGLRMGPIEPRIYQEWQGGAQFAEYEMELSPFESFQFEGDAGVVEFRFFAQSQDERDGDVKIGANLALSFDTAAETDLTGLLGDWINAAISANTDGLAWTWNGERLEVIVPPDVETGLLSIRIPTIDDAVIEGVERLALLITNPTASTGFARITQTTANVVLVERDVATFRISGPATAPATGAASFTLSVDGLFTPGTTLTLSIAPAGTALTSDVSDWLAAFSAAVAGMDGLEFDGELGLLTWTIETQTGLDAITFEISFEDTAAGKTYGFTISGETISPAGNAIIADGGESALVSII